MIFPNIFCNSTVSKYQSISIEIQHGNFQGLIFAQGFFWVLIFAAILSSLPLEIWSTLPGGILHHNKRNCLPSCLDHYIVCHRVLNSCQKIIEIWKPVFQAWKKSRKTIKIEQFGFVFVFVFVFICLFKAFLAREELLLMAEGDERQPYFSLTETF